MKGLRVVTSSLLTLGLALASPVALAGEIAAVSANENNREIKPFNLVHRAYSGHFSEQGIPGFQGLVTAYESGQLDAEDLVQTAIDQGRLSPDTLEDQGYLHTVRSQLQHLELDDQGD